MTPPTEEVEDEPLTVKRKWDVPAGSLLWQDVSKQYVTVMSLTRFKIVFLFHVFFLNILWGKMVS